MAKVTKILKKMERSPDAVRWDDLVKVCDYYFGEPRQSGTSHKVYKMPWKGDPLVNIQEKNGMGKSYQVRQVLKAIAKINA